MPDFSTITAFLGSIKTATELAKAIKGADLTLEKAEMKLKMAELISALADAKIQAAEIQDLFREKDKEIAKLKKVLELKAKMVREDGVYYDKSLLNTLKSEPFCSHCWEVNYKAIHLIYQSTSSNGASFYKCPSCKNRYQIGGYEEF